MQNPTCVDLNIAAPCRERPRRGSAAFPRRLGLSSSELGDHAPQLGKTLELAVKEYIA